MDNFDLKNYISKNRIHGEEDKLIVERKKEGYDDREDESVSARRGKEADKKQSFKDRRDDSYGKFGKRDAEAKGKKKGPGKNKINKEGIEVQESATAVAAGVVSLLGGAVAADKIMKKLERGDFGEKGEKIADMLKSLGSAAGTTTQSRGFEEGVDLNMEDDIVPEVNKGYFKKEFGVGKKGFSMDDRKKIKETIKEAYLKLQEASYPFDQCVDDNEGRYGAEGAKKVCGAIRAAYGEGLVREDKRTDAEQEGYKDGFEDAKDDIEAELKKMKVSELKAKIREEIIDTLTEQEEDVDVDVEDKVEVDADVDVEDEVNVDAEGDDIEIEKRAVKAKVQVGLSPEEEIVQDSLKAAMDAAEAIGSETLADQIGNTITYFTRQFVVGNNSD